MTDYTGVKSRLFYLPVVVQTKRFLHKEARNSFFDLGVYLLKSKFGIEDKLRFP